MGKLNLVQYWVRGKEKGQTKRFSLMVWSKFHILITAIMNWAYTVFFLPLPPLLGLHHTVPCPDSLRRNWPCNYNAWRSSTVVFTATVAALNLPQLVFLYIFNLNLGSVINGPPASVGWEESDHRLDLFHLKHGGYMCVAHALAGQTPLPSQCHQSPFSPPVCNPKQIYFICKWTQSFHDLPNPPGFK